MSREIKFRAWDIGKEVFIPINKYAIISTDFNAFGVMSADWENYKEGEFFYSNSQVIDQFTGLKDKNGVEIYEGDICRILYTDWPSNTNAEITLEDYKKSISSVGRIEYFAPEFNIVMQDRYGDFSPQSLYYGKHGEIEVIGNIHQNSDLL